MKLLLDTHLLLWSAGDPDRLPAEARALFEDPNNELGFGSIPSIACSSRRRWSRELRW